MMCTQKAHKRKFEMSKFVSPRGLITFFENFPRGNRALIFLVKNLMEKSTKKRPMISRFISQFHQFWCDSSESEVLYTSDSDTNVCGTKNWKNKYVHTYGTKSQKLVKNWLKIHFFACVPFVCTYCENFDMILRSYIVSLTYFDFTGKALKVVKLWQFEIWHSLQWHGMQTPFKARRVVKGGVFTPLPFTKFWGSKILDFQPQNFFE